MAIFYPDEKVLVFIRGEWRIARIVRQRAFFRDFIVEFEDDSIDTIRLSQIAVGGDQADMRIVVEYPPK